MLTKALHRLAANPWVYDLIQLSAGERQSSQRLSVQIAPVRDQALVLDLAGGTGTARSQWSTHSHYICLDVDLRKLQRFQKKYPDGTALLSDASKVPVRTESVDVVLCTAASHHFSDEYLPMLFSEAMRVLKRSGRLIFLDIVWDPSRLGARVLWHYDRGSHPRTDETLYSSLSAHGKIIYWERFEIRLAHTCVVGVVVPDESALGAIGKSGNSAITQADSRP